MEKKNFMYGVFQNARRPDGFLGRIILSAMNKGHAPLARWAMSNIEWGKEWDVLDIGCGGGANLRQILKRCPAGKAFGVDLSPVSVSVARKKNRKNIGTRCFVERGAADDLPYEDAVFDTVTAFETIYFWGDLHSAFCEVERVLSDGGRFLICCEASDPENTRWSSRIDGMVVRSAENLTSLLSKAGFGDINIFRGKNERLCIVANKRKH